MSTPKTPDEIRAAVFRALDAAGENKYDQVTANPFEVACDLSTYDADLEGVPGSIVLYVIEWQARKRVTGITPGGWTCQCTWDNHPIRKHCRHCGRARPLEVTA